MFSSDSSTSVVDSREVGEIRRPAVEVDEHVVITASSVGSGTLQADAAAKQKPAAECLLKSTEAISSSRLYSDTQTQRTQNREEKKMLREDRE